MEDGGPCLCGNQFPMNDSELHWLRAMTPGLVLMIALVLTHATVISIGTGTCILLLR